jgi:DNA polymerase III epsilon subunit-like protein
MALMKLCDKPRAFVDTETTGLDPIVNEIIEFAAIKGDQILTMKIKPRRLHLAQARALAVNGYNEADWADAMDITEAAPKIIAFLRDTVFVAHNTAFDAGFIEAFLREARIAERFSYHSVDTTALAYEHLVPKGLESLSLKPVCEFLGIPPEPTVHRALAGARACKAVYEKLTAKPKTRFFSFDGEHHETHDTVEQAKEACQIALEHYKDAAGDGWDEAVNNVCWGEIRQMSTECDRIDNTPEEQEASGMSYRCDYKMTDVAN